ncbi:hypothetical protein MTO96_005732 [Rhipicephalus appendiculatus]
MASSGHPSQKQQVPASSYNKFLTCLGASSPLLLCPLLFEGSKESRCGFCISTVSILLLTETLPTPITALLPLFIFTDLGLADDACLQMSIFSETLLVVLGEVMMVFLLCLTSVYQRISLLALDAFGARLRTVALICMTTALLAPLILHDTLAALLVLSLVRRLVADYMSDNIQSCMAQQEREAQRRQLVPSNPCRSGLPGTSSAMMFSDIDSTLAPTPLDPAPEPQAEAGTSATLRRLAAVGKEARGIPAAQRSALERSLRSRDLYDDSRRLLAPIGKAPLSALSLLSAHPPLPTSFSTDPPATGHPTTSSPTASERATRGGNANSGQPLRSPSRKSSFGSDLLSDEQGALRSRLPPHRPSLVSGNQKGPAKKTRKRTSIMEGGRIVIPGASSPPPKATASNSEDWSSFLCGTRRPLREYVGVKYQKQQTIHQHLAMTTVIACTLSSAMSLSRNRANVYFLDYFREFSTEATSHVVWMALVLPMECVTLMVAWIHVRVFVLQHFDQELNKNTEFNIQLFLQKKRHGMGTIGRIECLPVLLFGAWTIVHSITDKNIGFSTTADDMNPISVLCMVVAYSIPLTKWVHGVFMDFDGIVRRLPWGAIITVAGSDAIMLIIKVSGFTQWLSTQLQRYAMSQLVMQFVLALCSSLLTELVSNTSAVSVLLPVAVDIAVTTPCNPLYFAIPVTVAASTSLVLPTSGVSLAVLTNLVDVGPVQLLVLGLSLKFVALIMILLTVNLNSDFHRLPQWIFTERRNQTATTIF